MINGGIFLWEITCGQTQAFIFKWGLVPAGINFFDLSTLHPFITGMFLHGGFIHVLGNMWFLAVFGKAVEAAYGHIKFIIAYIFWGILAFLVQYFLMRDSQIPMVGASGAIAGVLGSYLVFYSRARVLTLVPIFFYITVIWIPAFFFIPYWFFIQVFSGVTQVAQGAMAGPQVAFWAHIGGFVAGYFTAKIKSG